MQIIRKLLQQDEDMEHSICGNHHSFIGSTDTDHLLTQETIISMEVSYSYSW